MVLSQRCDYALRALVELGAVHRSGVRLTAKALATKEGIPLNFLEQILLTLKKSGFVRSTMGAHGGYQLAQPPDRITFGEVIRAVDGPWGPIACVNENHTPECAERGHCKFRRVMVRLRDAMGSVVDYTTLADVLS